MHQQSDLFQTIPSLSGWVIGADHIYPCLPRHDIVHDLQKILWLKEGKGSASLDGFFRMLTREQKADIEIVSIDRGNAYLKALREHLPHVSISLDLRAHRRNELDDSSPPTQNPWSTLPLMISDSNSGS